jgi:hypothetical protein
LFIEHIQQVEQHFWGNKIVRALSKDYVLAKLTLALAYSKRNAKGHETLQA